MLDNSKRLIGAIMTFTWTEELSIGNAIIDSEHRDLIRMVNDVVHAIRTVDCRALSQALQKLEDKLYIHFAIEEKIARSVNFDFAQHRLAQLRSLKEFQYLKDELTDKWGIWSERAVEHYVHSLEDWAIDDHIIKLDMLMKPALQAYGYDFMPNCA